MKFYKSIIGNLILFGHGIKPFGHAIIDETFFLIYALFNKNEKKYSPKSFYLFFISLIIIINSTLSIILNLNFENKLINFFGLPDPFYKLHMLCIGVCILFLSFLDRDFFKLVNFKLAAIVYIICNILFLLFEQLALNYSGGVLYCRSIETMSDYYREYVYKNKLNDCLINLAYHQNFWTGTAYSSVGLFFSNIILFNSIKKSYLHYILIGTYFLIVIYLDSKIGMIFFLLYLIYILNFLNKKHILFLLITIISLGILEISFFVLFEKLFGMSTLSILEIIQRSNAVNLLLTFLNMFHSLHDFFIQPFNLGHVNNYTFFDEGRLEQITGLYNYFVNSSITSNFFGKLTGFHRFGLEDYMTQDTSEIFRPIGIVVLIVDWGFLILIVMVLQYLNILFNYFNNYFNGQISTFYLITIFCIYTFLFLMPFITNLIDSILYWLLISNIYLINKRNYDM